jgi:hypothetical protein
MAVIYNYHNFFYKCPFSQPALSFPITVYLSHERSEVFTAQFSGFLSRVVWWTEDCAASIFSVEMKTEAARFSETLVSNHHTTGCTNPERHELYLHILIS